MNTIAVILAGGASTRMGVDKALLKIQNQTMIDRALQLLEQTSVSQVVISRNDSSSGYIPDLIPHKGPLSGIHSAAMRFPNDNLLIIPVDLPLLNYSTIQTLIDQGNSSDNNVRYGKHNLPLFLHNSPLLRLKLDYTLRFTNCFSVNRLCSHFPLIEINAERQSSLFNANSPDEWRFAMQHFQPIDSPIFNEDSHESFKQKV
jgi:molybdopterin-guanine dinucleotide biosynthesis protein A